MKESALAFNEGSKMTDWPFQENRMYNRRRDVHQVFGGQQQGGISTPVRAPAVFIFTGHGAEKHGYADKFLPDGSFRFTGEGQIGDMRMIKGNKAIRDHAADGKDILVFRKSGSREPVEFVGIFVCAGWEVERQPDTIGSERDAIVFTLVRLANIITEPINGEPDKISGKNLTDLRAAAYLAQSVPSSNTGKASRNIYERSRDVREYVLARSGGKCENCQQDAPFKTKYGRGYLEPHHIRRLNDGGLDHPAHVAAVCPNCHRRAHYGVDGEKMNKLLATQISDLELTLSNG